MNSFHIGLVLYSIYIIRRIFFYIYLWQLKEYRIDRLISFLRTPTGKSLFLNPILYIKWIICALFFFVQFYPFHKTDFIFLSIIVFVFLIATPISFYIIGGLVSLISLLRNRWKIPVFTFKVLGILTVIGALLITNVGIYWLKNDVPWFGFLFLVLFDVLILPITSLVVLLLNIPSEIYKKYVAAKAKGKIERMKNLTVIGITGSVGKTSTKEFLAQILEAKYKVAKTPESINTEIGIAKFILNDLKEDTEMFVVEMGAYKKGEIKTVCDMVHPKIGIITYIGTQHLELFGSMQNLIDAKYELIKSLPRNNIAVFNEENEYCRILAQKAREEGKKVMLYGRNKEKIKIYPSPKLLGKQTIPNLLAAILAAEALNVSAKQIKSQVFQITPPRNTMELVGEYKGANLIDDTFNISRESVLAALEYMLEYKGKKILILSPLIELGSAKNHIIEKVIKKTKETCDHVYLTNKNIPSIVKEKIDKALENDSVIVFEGKEAKKYLKMFTNH